jgi:hypothetical protein
MHRGLSKGLQIHKSPSKPLNSLNSSFSTKANMSKQVISTEDAPKAIGPYR